MEEHEETSNHSSGNSTVASERFNDSPTLVAQSLGDDVEEVGNDEGDGTGHQNKGSDADSKDDNDDKNSDSSDEHRDHRSGNNENHENHENHDPAFSVSPLSSSSEPPPKIKVTMSFMKAYKAMRGPRDVEPSPLFGCLAKQGGANGGVEDDPFRLAGRDEIKLLNDVNDEIVWDSDAEDGNERRRSVGVSGDERQTVFWFEQPDTTPVLQRVSSLSDDDDDIDIEDDYPLDHDKMDQGWIKANAPYDSDDEYVSDDDGDPRDTRISPAVFRALAEGCTRDNVDSLRIEVAGTVCRPRTPTDKILSVSADISHRNNVAPHCYRRQFDTDSGEELSPAYRTTAQGPAASVLWSPPGVTPERVGTFLLLLRQGYGEQLLPSRGTGVPTLFQRMAPLECRELRMRLYGQEWQGRASVSTMSTSSATSSSASSASSPTSGSSSTKKDVRNITYSWAEVNDAVHSCRFDPRTTSLTMDGQDGQDGQEPGCASRTSSELSSDLSSGHSSGPSSRALATERALLETFRSRWRTIQASRAEDARLAAANERAQAVATVQARCLAGIESQVAACREAERAAERERQQADRREAEAHYQKVCRAERRAEKQEKRRRRRCRHILHSINEQLQNLAMTARETEARVVQGRQLQTVLAQQLRDGEARLARLCQAHEVADVAALSRTLAAKVAQLGKRGEESDGSGNGSEGDGLSETF